MPALRVASLARDIDLIEMTREDAAAIIACDPELTLPVHAPLREWLRNTIGDAWEWVSSG
jgi:RecG-like helicase